jgi:putative transposase
MPQSLTKLYAHLTLARRIASRSWMRRFDRESMPTWQRSFEKWIRRGSLWVALPIMSTFFSIWGRGAPVDFVEQTKRESSKFIKTLGEKHTQFYWQRGYGMFSVGPAHRDEAEEYVRKQEEHHRVKTFQEEFRAFLVRYGVGYDEQYVWD